MARLLLVDPDAERREALARAIRQRGHTVLDLAGPVEALDAIQRAQVDLVFATVDALGGPGRPLARALGERSRGILVWLGESAVLKKVRGEGAPVAGFLPLPVPDAALEGLLQRLAGDAGPTWSGHAFLRVVDGTSVRYPVPRVLFLVHRLQASGRLSVGGPEGEVIVDLRDGRVVDVLGLPGLAPGLPDGPRPSLEAAVGAAIASGRPPDRALEQAAVALGAWAVAARGRPELRVRFAVGFAGDGAGFPLPLTVPRIIARGLQLARGPSRIRESFAPYVDALVKVELPDDAPEQRWGLPPAALRMVREATRLKTLGQLVSYGESGGSDETWLAADLLLVLGFIAVEGQDGVSIPAEDLTTALPDDLSGGAEVDEASTGMGYAFAEDPSVAQLRDGAYPGTAALGAPRAVDAVGTGSGAAAGAVDRERRPDEGEDEDEDLDESVRFDESLSFGAAGDLDDTGAFDDTGAYAVEGTGSFAVHDGEDPETLGQPETVPDSVPDSVDPATRQRLELQATLARLRRQGPAEVLGLTTSAAATPEGVEAAFRKVSAAFHPDRFGMATQAVRNLAASCFAVVGRAREDILADPDGLALLQKRLAAAEAGEVFLTSAEREVLGLRLKEARRALKRRAWEEAVRISAEVLEQDPESFQARFISVKARARSGELDLLEAATQLHAMVPTDPRSRAMLLYEKGELLLKADKEAAAYRAFKECVEADPEHIEARRRLRLREMREGPGKKRKSRPKQEEEDSGGTDLGSRIAGFFRRGR